MGISTAIGAPYSITRHFSVTILIGILKDVAPILRECGLDPRYLELTDGVETAEQLHALKGIECAAIQGYFLSRPPAGDRLRRVHTAESRDRLSPRSVRGMLTAVQPGNSMTRTRLSLPRFFLLAFLLFASQAHASGLVISQPGELPIILTAPHGGREDVPGCELRTPVGSRFVTSTDLNTDVLAESTAAEIRRLTGKSPYLVIARFHRKYIDANRRADEAYSGSACKAMYDEYHAITRRFVDEVRQKHRHAALFDIHGQAKYPDSILRGTQHGSTVQSLLARSGAEAVTGVNSVFGRFAARGYKIAPPNELPPTARVETQGYTGGHTVVTYGSNRPDGIDAIQLEFGRDLRRIGAVAKTAADTAKAIAVFYENYLKDAPRK